MLHLCTYCRRPFTTKQRETMTCSKAETSIDFHGNVLAQHVADTDWDISHYVQYCHKSLQLSWREIYWKVWGRVQTLYCTACHGNFPATELGHCSYHPEKPVWQCPPRAHSGVYPCCQQPAVRFGAAVQRTGCCAREHAVSNAEAATLRKLMRHKAIVCVPFEDRDKDTFPGCNLPGQMERDLEPAGTGVSAGEGDG